MGLQRGMNKKKKGEEKWFASSYLNKKIALDMAEAKIDGASLLCLQTNYKYTHLKTRTTKPQRFFHPFLRCSEYISP